MGVRFTSLLLAGCLFCTPASAQPTTQSQPAANMPATTSPSTSPATTLPAEAPPADAGGASELSIEAIQARLKQIEAGQELDAALKPKLLELYKRALDDLQRAKDWSAKAEQYEQQRKEAPIRLQEIKAELAKSAEAPKPQVPHDASVQQIEQLLAQAEVDARKARRAVSDIEEDRKRRAARQTKVPELSSDARQKIREVNAELNAPAATEESADLLAAKDAARQAFKKAEQAKVDAYRKELSFYEASGELLVARQDLARREADQADKLVQGHRDVVNSRRRAEAEAAVQAAEQAKRATAQSHPAIQKLAEENAEIATARTAMAAKLEQLVKKREELRKQSRQVREEFQSVQAKIEAGGLTHSIGVLLLRERDRLPNIREHQKAIAVRREQISEAQLALLSREEQRTDVRELEPAVNRFMQQLQPEASLSQREEIEAEARQLFAARRDFLGALLTDANSYFNKLVDLDTAERQLVASLTRFLNYIDERILWTRSTSPASTADWESARDTVRWLSWRSNWETTLRTLQDAVRENPVSTGLGGLSFLALLLSQKRARSRLRRIGDEAAKGSMQRFAPTLEALALTVAISVVWPLLMLLVGWLLSTQPDARQFARALAHGLKTTAVLWIAAALVRQMTRPRGLVEAHFAWAPNSVQVLRRNVSWLMLAGLPILLVVSMIDYTGVDERQNSLGRWAFMVGNLLLAIFAQRVLSPKRGVLRERLARHQHDWLYRLRFVWYPLGVMLPLVLIALAATGYYYTATQLTWRIHHTVMLIMGAVVVDGLALRWLVVSRRRLVLAEAEKRQAEGKPTAVEEISPAGRPVEQAERHIDLSDIGHQSRQLIRSLVGLSLVLGLWFIWEQVLPALSILKQVELWPYTVKSPTASTGEKLMSITLADLALSILVVLLTVVATKNVPGLLEIAVLQRTSLKRGERYAVTTIVRYVMTAVGVVITCSTLGISWGSVQWLVAAMTVGLGFGMQEIFANFVSGLIILFERPIRVGDIVTVGGVEGKVSQIRIRATTIRDWNRRELVVPNKEFITGRFLNWTLSDSVTRVVIPVNVAPGSESRKVHELLSRIAVENPLVLEQPKPKVLLKNIAPKAMEFEIYAYLADPDKWPDLIDQVQTRIAEDFSKAGIAMAIA